MRTLRYRLSLDHEDHKIQLRGINIRSLEVTTVSDLEVIATIDAALEDSFEEWLDLNIAEWEYLGIPRQARAAAADPAPGGEV